MTEVYLLIWSDGYSESCVKDVFLDESKALEALEKARESSNYVFDFFEIDTWIVED